MMRTIQKQLVITREYHHQRIDSVLAQLLPEYSRSQLCGWIKTGKITCNQKPCKPKDKLSFEDHVEINVQLTETSTDFSTCQPENIPLNIVYEDADVLVLNKPAGLVVHPGAGNSQHTLVNALLHHDPQLKHVPRAGIIHRLDKDTTGLLIVAKSLEAHTCLIRQMQAREIQRHYTALVYGHVVSGGTIDTGFGRDSRNRLKMAVMEQGRQAITTYRVRQQFSHCTLLDVSLMTGRTHQIRVHLAHINHAILGDPLYKSKTRMPSPMNAALKSAIDQFKRQALHACSITFNHPVNANTLTFTAPLPDDFNQLLTFVDENEQNIH